jgi:hypothetical protein
MGQPTNEEHDEVKKLQQAVSDARFIYDKLSEAKKAAADDVAYAQANFYKIKDDIFDFFLINGIPPGEYLRQREIAAADWLAATQKYNQLVNDYELADSDYRGKLTELSHSWISLTTKDIVGGAEDSIKTHASDAVAGDTKP